MHVLCTSAFVPVWICVFLCVLLGQCVQRVGQARPACQCVEHLWHPCHPRSPSSAPKQGNWEGGQAHRAVPKLSLFITATETGRGRQVARPLVLTYCDHLLLHSVCLCEWVGVQVCLGMKKTQRKPITYVFEQGSAYFIFDLWMCLCVSDRLLHWSKVPVHAHLLMAMPTYLQMYRNSAFGESGVLLWHFLDRAQSSSSQHTATPSGN